MNDHYKEVLIAIVALSRKESSGKVRRSSIAQNTKLDDARLKACLESLKHAHFIKIEKSAKIGTLISPTIPGIEKADSWKVELRNQSLPGKLRSAAKWAGGGLATASLVLLVWYFGFSPDSIGIQPFDARIPIRVYDVGTYPSIDPRSGWLSFTPPRSIPVSIDQELHLYEKNDLLSILGEYFPATLSGDVYFRFAIENVATKYQVDIDSIDIIVRQQSGKKIADLYTLPVWGLGGAEVWEYEVSITRDSGKPLDDGSRIYHATMTANDIAVDYIYVEPGKRENISVHVELDDIGNYTLIPVMTFSFRDKTSKLTVNPYSIVYPQFYRSWVVDPQANMLDTSHMIVNNLTGEVEQESTNSAGTKACLPQRKWIFFTSTMIEWGVLHQTFIIDSNGESLRLLDSNYYDPRNDLFVAWTKDGLVRLKYEDYVDNQSTYTYELFDPRSGEKKSWAEDIENSLEPNSETGGSYSSSYTTPDGDWTLTGGDQLTLTKTNGSCNQTILKPHFGEINNISLQP